VPPGAFLQPSRAGEQALIDCVVAGVGDAAACVVDLFCGMGTFSYPLAVRGADVCGFDVDVASLQRSGVVFKSRNLYRDPLTARELADYDTIVFDPPRAGAKAQAPEIAESGVAKIVAVSCNPGTFISDCAPFLAAGYRFTDLWVVDQFIWSSHIEMVGVFVNKE
jgi:23S rRNA (uracil1939-C5)-methyltransferase